MCLIEVDGLLLSKVHIDYGRKQIEMAENKGKRKLGEEKQDTLRVNKSKQDKARSNTQRNDKKKHPHKLQRLSQNFPKGWKMRKSG